MAQPQAECDNDFFSEIKNILQTLYRDEKTGWVKAHTTDINTAIAATGLDLTHIKVRSCLGLVAAF